MKLLGKLGCFWRKSFCCNGLRRAGGARRCKSLVFKHLQLKAPCFWSSSVPSGGTFFVPSTKKRPPVTPERIRGSRGGANDQREAGHYAGEETLGFDKLSVNKQVFNLVNLKDTNIFTLVVVYRTDECFALVLKQSGSDSLSVWRR